MDKLEQDPAQLRIGFIGAGRLGTALAWSFAAARTARRRRRQHDSGRCRTAGRTDHRLRREADGQQVVDGCDLVFVTTPDGAIADTTAQFRWRPGVAAVHCSGVTDVAALDHCRTRGRDDRRLPSDADVRRPRGGRALAAGLHDHHRSAGTAQRGAGRDRAAARMPDQPPAAGHARPLSRRGRLHVAIHQRAVRGGRRRSGNRGARPKRTPCARCCRSRAARWRRSNPPAWPTGMPGPVSRGDVGSIEKHVAALTPLGPEVMEFYRVVCDRTIPLGMQRGAIDDAPRRGCARSCSATRLRPPRRRARRR